MKYYIWLLVITFKLPLRKIYKNAFLFSFINFKKNLIVGIASLLYYALMVVIFWAIPNSFVITLLILITIMFYVGFKQLLVLYCVFPSVEKVMIIPYSEKNPDADIELRRNLGLINEDEDEAVFNDERILKADE